MRRPNIDIHVLQSLLALSVVILCLVGVAMARTEAKPKPYRIPPPPDFSLQLSADGSAFEFQGVVDFGLTDALRALVAAHPDVKRITLESAGGYVSEARGVVTVLRAGGIATHVDGHCASACTLIFVGGAARSLAPKARIGLHGYAMQRERHFGMIDPVVEMQRDLTIFRRQGIAEEFVARLPDLPQTPMWYPTHETLRIAGLITQP